MHISKQIWIPAIIIGMIVIAVLASNSSVQNAVSPIGETATSGGYDEDKSVDSSLGGRGSVAYPSPEPMPPTDGSGLEAGEHIIKTGTLGIRVANIEKGVSELDAIATLYKGEILNRSINTYADETYGYVTLRVESTEFENAMRDIKTIATFISSEDVSTDDVTATVIDIEARLENARAEEASYLSILNRATTVEEILMVQNYLSQVRATIESYEAQLDYYASRTAFSIITVNLTEEGTVQFESPAFRPLQTVIDAAQTVVELLQDLVIALIYIVIVGGAVGIPLALITWIVMRVARNRGGKKRK